MLNSAKPAIPLEAVIFDWAGTLVDYGSLAPTQSLSMHSKASA